MQFRLAIVARIELEMAEDFAMIVHLEEKKEKEERNWWWMKRRRRREGKEGSGR